MWGFFHFNCCHTYPNDRLLQPAKDNGGVRTLTVVIPTQTVGFYNEPKAEDNRFAKKLSYLPKR